MTFSVVGYYAAHVGRSEELKFQIRDHRVLCSVKDEMNSSSSDSVVCSILDIPDEILVKIISRFNARKRLALACSCKRFHSLVFGDEELLRDLDFSKNGRLTTPTHIYRYFGDEESRKHVRRVNIQNVICMGPGVKMLNDTIGKATNLVDVNILGITFKDIEEVSSFLEPLVQIRRLSMDWPHCRKDNVAMWEKVLQKRFSKLEYLSTEIHKSLKVFFSAVQLCTELEELKIFGSVSADDEYHSSYWVLKPNKVENLKIVQIRGLSAVFLRKPVISMLSDISRWTEFQLIYAFEKDGYYFEKDVEICEQLRSSEWLKKIGCNECKVSEPGLTVDYKSLLQEIIRVTHENVPETFCCSGTLSPEFEEHFKYPSINIDDVKQLLRNPGHQLSSLYLPHCIESDCDAHLFVSAFKDVTELVLSDIKITKASTQTRRKNFARRLKRKDSSAAEEPDASSNLDSSFLMLVQNTPHVKELTISSTYRCRREEWDVESLSLISKWRNLTALRLARIPLKDGKFLIDIGQQCPKLEILVIHRLAKERVGCHTSDLSKMLLQCRNLREFWIHEDEMDYLPKIVASLSNNLKLRRFHVRTLYKISLTPDLMSSIEGLLRNCVKLNTFVCRINWSSENCSDQLASALRRIRSELNRPKFQFELYPNYDVHEDAPTSFLSPKFDWVE